MGVGERAEEVQDVKYGPPANLESTMIAVWAKSTFESTNKSIMTQITPFYPATYGEGAADDRGSARCQGLGFACECYAPILGGTLARGRVNTGIRAELWELEFWLYQGSFLSEPQFPHL